MAYTDSCLGDFIKNLKQTEAWKNTVVVLVPDHAMRYPYDIDNRAVDEYKIPLVVIGGALSSKDASKPMVRKLILLLRFWHN